MDSKHYYDLLMKSFEDAISDGSGIIKIRNNATNKEFKMPVGSTPVNKPPKTTAKKPAGKGKKK